MTFDTEALIRLFLATMRSIKGKLHAVGGMAPFSHVQLETLLFLDTHDQATMKMLSDHLAIQPPSATTIINGLVKNGKLVRRLRAKDRRLTLLTLTPEGKKALVNRYAFISEHLRGYFDRLEPKEKENLFTVLEKLNR